MLRALPRVVTVMGHTFPVALVDLPDGGHGQLFLDPHRIEISSNDTLDIQWATLVHEILHAGIRLGGLQSILEATSVPGVEEAIVSNLERTLLSVRLGTKPLVNCRK